MSTFASIWINSMRCDNVSLIVFGKPDRDPPPAWWPDPPLRTLTPTKGRPIDHIAFSYRAIEPVFERMKRAGVRIVEPIAVREPLKLKSFFVLAPDEVLVEIVEAAPIPEAAWEELSPPAAQLARPIRLPAAPGKTDILRVSRHEPMYCPCSPPGSPSPWVWHAGTAAFVSASSMSMPRRRWEARWPTTRPRGWSSRSVAAASS